MRVVLVRLSALGDIVHTWPLAEALRELSRPLHLTWIAEESLRPLVDGHPAVDAVIAVRTAAWRRRPFAARSRAEIGALRSRLHELQPDVVLDPQGVLKSALITRWSGATRRVGLERPWRREWASGLAYTETVPGAPAGSHVAATNLQLVRALGLRPPEPVTCNGSWLLERVGDSRPGGARSSAPVAVLLPGAGGAHKVLPESTLASVGRGLQELGLAPVVAWGPGEQERAQRIADRAGVDLAPPTDLEELAALLGSAALVVGGDTGPTHLAASFNVPTVAVFVASDWRRNGPLGTRTRVVSGANESRPVPSGSARTGVARSVDADEILAAAGELLT